MLATGALQPTDSEVQMSGIQIVPAELTGFILETWVFGETSPLYHTVAV